jgi:hypothetical protein
MGITPQGKCKDTESLAAKTAKAFLGGLRDLLCLGLRLDLEHDTLQIPSQPQKSSCENAN